MPYRCAILDDYHKVALSIADWSVCRPEVEVVAFHEPMGDMETIVSALCDFDIVCLMRERTPFPKEVISRLPRLKMIATTGMRNDVIDLDEASKRGILVSGTKSGKHPTVELVFAHLLEHVRKVGYENARLKTGAAWQETLGGDLEGKTFGILGLGQLGTTVARIAHAFGMEVIAWSPNLTPEKCHGTPARYIDKTSLFSTADIISIHLRLGERSRGLVGAAELAAMKPQGVLINTSRGPIVDEQALVDALRHGRIGAALLDVYDQEPLPLDHAFRSLERAQITPHLGYVTMDNYEAGYIQLAENVASFVSGAPVRVLNG